MDDVSTRRSRHAHASHAPKARRSRVLVAAVAGALAVGVLGATGAQAGSGGISSGGSSGGDSQRTKTSAAPGGCAGAAFGQRRLALGDCGEDVKTLNWILKSRQEGQKVRPKENFIRRTARAVRTIQRNQGLKRSGVVNDRTRKALVKRMDRSLATWYGPGFWGNQTACGQTLKKATIGVAHKKLPCGTRVTVEYRGKFVRAKVIDRGPYAHGATWDLTQATARKIGMDGTSTVRAAVIR